jgi:uncharacterized peroxidase-related enzyme
VNRPVYCVAVHAGRHIALAKRPEVIEEIFAKETGAELDGRIQAVFDFAASLSRTPSQANAEQVAALRAQGLDELEILDLILSASIFGWANRLMHTLGEPVKRE